LSSLTLIALLALIKELMYNYRCNKEKL